MTATAMTATMAMIHPDDESSTEIGSEATSAINKETFTANSVHAVGRFFEDGSWPQRGGNGIGRRRVDLGVSNANQVTVYWRPGCPFCSLLRAGLRRHEVEFEQVNIWEDPEAAAFVRSVARGNETVPTVTVGDTALVNPSAAEVAQLARGGATV